MTNGMWLLGIPTIKSRKLETWNSKEQRYFLYKVNIKLYSFNIKDHNQTHLHDQTQ